VSDSDGLTFGRAAEAYERGRPGWPEEILDAVPVPPGSEVLDLGAGTGKLTRLLATRFRVFAVEPDAEMRAALRGVEVLAGTAEAIPLPDESVDAVFAAEAYHWFDPSRALPEIARVLRPRGVVAVIWNRADPGRRVLPEGVLPEKPHSRRIYDDDEWRRGLEAAPFEPLREVLFPREQEVSRAVMLEFFSSISPVTALAPRERRKVLDRVAAALDRPTYQRRWTVMLVWTRLAD
jgi:SAM-dependent methyltransferase